MSKPIGLIIASEDSALGGISKLMEARDYSIHVSHSITDAENALDKLRELFARLINSSSPGSSGFCGLPG